MGKIDMTGLLRRPNPRELTGEEIEKWVMPYVKSLLSGTKPHLVNSQFEQSRLSGECTQILDEEYKRGNLPYSIQAYVGADPFVPYRLVTKFVTDCQEVVLDWSPKAETIEVSVSKRDTEWSNAIVQHFKRETLTAEERAANKYLYQIKGLAEHTESGEKLVIYQALYAPFAMYARPADMFFSKVDRTKYPDIKQEYRFQKVEDYHG